MHDHAAGGHDPHDHDDHAHHDGDGGGQERRAGHQHVHGVDPALLATDRGLWAVKWSFVGLFITAAIQLVVVLATGSVALLADTFHNLSDAATAIPLSIAFTLGKRPPSLRFTYGFGRAEDIAGVIVVLMILASAVAAAVESVSHLLAPQAVQHLWAVIAASLVGFGGNEAVARFRIRVGKEIGSAALVADGEHARADSLTSLAVLVGAVGVAVGFRQADPLMGLIISLLILRIVWESGGAVLGRLLDSVDPEVAQEVRAVAAETAGVRAVTEVRVRWLGHRLLAELNLAVAHDLSVVAAHSIAAEVQHELLHRLRYLYNAVIHVDPEPASGEGFHRPQEHEHGGHGVHGH
ncbi:MAG: cation diffusion facilitator family transporter [Chloroflexota bacterium]